MYLGRANQFLRKGWALAGLMQAAQGIGQSVGLRRQMSNSVSPILSRASNKQLTSQGAHFMLCLAAECNLQGRGVVAKEHPSLLKFTVPHHYQKKP